MEEQNILKKNLTFLDRVDRNFSLFPQSFLSDSEREEGAELILKESLPPTLRVRDEHGKMLTLHSPVAPFKEAEKLVGTCLPVAPDTILVILGLGLGYHVKEIMRRIHAGQPVIIVEQSQAVWEQALYHIDLTEFLEIASVYWLIDPDEKAVLQNISRIQLRHALAGFSLLIHPASYRSRPTFYDYLSHHLRISQRVNIKDKLRYRKFRDEKVRILILNTNYFIITEIIRSLERMGHPYRVVIIEDREMARDEVMERIVSEIVTFRPDFVLTMNHLGFDREGIMTNFFTSIELPFAAWYVDSPILIIRHYEKNRSPFLSLFLWDSDYLQDVKDLGFERYCYLPLAADELLFRPIPISQNRLGVSRYPVSFVGNSMVHQVRKNLLKSGFDFGLLPLFYDLSNRFMTSDRRHVYEVIDSMDNNYPWIKLMKEEDRIDFEGAITWQATLDYRFKTISNLAPLHPHIFGDSGWKALLDGHFHLHPEISYYDGLPYVYNQSDINFNATSLQMKNGLNQRVFDVPACGNFLLTDYRSQIEELFKVGEEVICYHDEEEALDLAKFYLKNNSARYKIARAARERILKEHCCVHRLNYMIERMRKDYA